LAGASHQSCSQRWPEPATRAAASVDWSQPPELQPALTGAMGQVEPPHVCPCPSKVKPGPATQNTHGLPWRAACTPAAQARGESSFVTDDSAAHRHAVNPRLLLTTQLPTGTQPPLRRGAPLPSGTQSDLYHVTHHFADARGASCGPGPPCLPGAATCTIMPPPHASSHRCHVHHHAAALARTLILAFCASLRVWYLSMSMRLAWPVAGEPGTTSSALREPPPRLRLILAARRNRVEKKLRVQERGAAKAVQLRKNRAENRVCERRGGKKGRDQWRRMTARRRGGGMHGHPKVR